MKNARTLVTVGLLISTEIILTWFLLFQTSIVRISFGFLPIALSAIMFGSVVGGMAAAIADIFRMMIFPKGAYFPGFTFSALISGAVYGVFLHNKPITILRTALAVLLIALLVDMGLNTLWLSMITGKAALVLLPPRLLKTLIMYPIQVSVILNYLEIHKKLFDL